MKKVWTQKVGLWYKITTWQKLFSVCRWFPRGSVFINLFDAMCMICISLQHILKYCVNTSFSTVPSENCFSTPRFLGIFKIIFPDWKIWELIFFGACNFVAVSTKHFKDNSFVWACWCRKNILLSTALLECPGWIFKFLLYISFYFKNVNMFIYVCEENMLSFCIKIV